MTDRVLVVDDDPDVLTLIAGELRASGFEVDATSDGRAAVDLAIGGGFDLVVLDINLPGVSGSELCRNIRARNSDVPIVFLTSRSDEVDRVTGFLLGADDYLTKPFSARELALRIRAILKRRSAAAAAAAPVDGPKSLMTFGGLTIDPEKRRVVLNGQPLQLTTLEFDILAFLASHPGRPFSREELMTQIWGYESSSFGPSVTAQMTRLRRKLEQDMENPRFIHTVYGFGYRFADPDVDPL